MTEHIEKLLPILAGLKDANERGAAHWEAEYTKADTKLWAIESLKLQYTARGRAQAYELIAEMVNEIITNGRQNAEAP